MSEAQHWIIIGLIIFLIGTIGIAAAWSIGKVNTQLMVIHSTLRDIAGYMLITASMERSRASNYPQTTIETPSTRIEVSGGTVPEDVPR